MASAPTFGLKFFIAFIMTLTLTMTLKGNSFICNYVSTTTLVDNDILAL
jgi:hypothetical protein